MCVLEPCADDQYQSEFIAFPCESWSGNESIFINNSKVLISRIPAGVQGLTINVDASFDIDIFLHGNQCKLLVKPQVKYSEVCGLPQ